MRRPLRLQVYQPASGGGWVVLPHQTLTVNKMLEKPLGHSFKTTFESRLPILLKPTINASSEGRDSAFLVTVCTKLDSIAVTEELVRDYPARGQALLHDMD